MRAPTRFAVQCLELVALNFAIFLVYRLVFLMAFADAGARTGDLGVLLRGLRLDAALVAGELLVLAVASLASRYLRYSLVLGGLWAFACVNVLAAVANLLFFRERNQHLWENLLANAAEPREVWIAVEPFVREHPGLPVAVVVVAAAVVLIAARHGRALAGQRLDLWGNPRALAGLVAVVLLLLAANLEPIDTQQRSVFGHFRIGATASKYYTQFDDYLLNQAVMNPVFDLVRGSLAAAESGGHPYTLSSTEALGAAEALLGLRPRDQRYPLLRTIHGEGGLGIRNVVLLQIEGLGTNVLERRARDGYLMPYLRELAAQGLYFPNVLQSFCATDGSTFAIATSLHRTYAVSRGVSHFFPHEVNGRYGALSRVLGAGGYRHYFFAGFRQRTADFLTFMGNQGYEAVGFDQLAERLGERAERESNTLGIFDGPLLEEVAEDLVDTAGPFTAHVATTTSHSPWQVPPGTTSALEGPPAAFRYVDESIRAFVERLRRGRADFDRTLFVLVGDHTSVTFTNGFMERIRVPLILYSTGLAAQRERWLDRQAARASHVDVLPTVLALLDGAHPYSGMGRNLLGGDGGTAGVISSNYGASLYVDDDFALRYAPRDGASDLFAFSAGELIPRDVTAARPDVAARLTGEYLALFETADRLTREKRIFPRDGGAARALLAAR